MKSFVYSILFIFSLLFSCNTSSIYSQSIDFKPNTVYTIEYTSTLYGIYLLGENRLHDSIAIFLAWAKSPFDNVSFHEEKSSYESLNIYNVYFDSINCTNINEIIKCGRRTWYKVSVGTIKRFTEEQRKRFPIQIQHYYYGFERLPKFWDKIGEKMYETTITFNCILPDSPDQILERYY